MISTVTTSTVTTMTAIAALGLTAAMSIATIVTLISFLSVKELAGASRSITLRLTARFLNVGIIPIIMAFAVIIVVKVAEILA